MATFYAITPPSMPAGECGSIIRSGTLPEMLWYVQSDPSAWKLYRITRRGHWHLMDIAAELERYAATSG
jgi:hypothetical protein